MVISKNRSSVRKVDNYLDLFVSIYIYIVDICTAILNIVFRDFIENIRSSLH